MTTIVSLNLSSELIKAIKKARAVYVGVNVSHHDMTYFKVSKQEAIKTVGYTQTQLNIEGTYRAHLDVEDNTVWIA
jgi:sensor c-di-GMP phosphodiesterase-like protein